MNPSRKYTWAVIKTFLTHLTLLGILLFGNIIYALIKNLNITEQVLRYNNPFFFYNNLVLFLLIGVFYFSKAKKEDDILNI